MFERSWAAVPPTLFTSNGSANGYITVVSTLGFRVKAEVVIQAAGQPNLTLQCKRVISQTQMVVGPISGPITNYKVDLSAYTLTAGAFIYQDLQAKVSLTPQDILQAIYNQEPICSISTTAVDEYGNPYGPNNPYPITFDGTVSIGEVEIKGSSGNILDVNTDGSLKPIGLFNKPYDTITATYPTTTQEVYSSRIGGLSGTIQQTVIIDYTDVTKNFLLDAYRSFG